MEVSNHARGKNASSMNVGYTEVWKHVLILYILIEAKVKNKVVLLRGRE